MEKSKLIEISNKELVETNGGNPGIFIALPILFGAFVIDSLFNYDAAADALVKGWNDGIAAANQNNNKNVDE